MESLSVKDFGFRTDFPDNGRPAYHPADLLKLFIYGYLNKVRSSRDLEKECFRNIEVMWLLKCLRPDHNTISNFRRENGKAIRKVFAVTVQIAKHFDRIGAEDSAEAWCGDNCCSSIRAIHQPGSRSRLKLRAFQIQPTGRYLHMSPGTGSVHQRIMV